jgi:hypothetical protein
MTHSPRPRRFRKTAAALARTLGYLTTAAVMVRNGIPAQVAERYSAQITKTAAKNGVQPTAITYTKQNGRHRATRAYNLATDGMALLLALVSYRPAAPKRLKTGQPSKAKAEQAKAQKLADYTAAIGQLALVA